MCLSPILIQNKAYDPNCVMSRKYISVPCGRCEHCIQRAQMALTFRATREMEYTIAHGGIAAFSTLTYAPHYLPVVYHTYKGKTCSLSCWCFNDIVRFFKRVLSACKAINPDAQVKHLLTCERGSRDNYVDSHGNIRKATWRPHYHIIWFVLGVSEYEFLSILDSQWHYGMVRNDGIDRDPVHAIAYVVKYAYKHYGDVSFNIKPENITDFKCSPYLPEKGRKEVRKMSSDDICPRTLQSNYIGISFLDAVKGLPFQQALDYYLFTAPKSPETGTPINIPRYYFKLGEGVKLSTLYPNTHYLFNVHRISSKMLKYDVPRYIYTSLQGLVPKYRQQSYRPLDELALRNVHCSDSPFGAVDLKVTTKSQTVTTFLGASYRNEVFFQSLDYYYNAFYHFVHKQCEFSANPSDYLEAPFFDKLCKVDKLTGEIIYPDGFDRLCSLYNTDLTNIWDIQHELFELEFLRYYQNPLRPSLYNSLFREVMDSIHFVQRFHALERIEDNKRKAAERLQQTIKEKPHLFEPVFVTDSVDSFIV